MIEIEQAMRVELIDETVHWSDAYEIVVYDDENTPIEFVIELLERYFYMSGQELAATTMRIHTTGRNGVGRLAKSTAESVTNAMLADVEKKNLRLRIETSKWSESRCGSS